METKLQLSGLDSYLEAKSSTIAKDLRLNLKRVLLESTLEAPEAALALLATATSVGSTTLSTFAREALKALDFSSEQIAEAAESAAMMAMLNTYYRFRHMLTHGQPELAEVYKTAGLRMTALARPVVGKQRFEMLAFAVSVLNGCESCIGSHEQVLRNDGVASDKIHDLARLASVVKACATLEGIA